MTGKVKTAFAQTNGKKKDHTSCSIDLIPDGIKRKPPIAVRERSNGRDSIPHSDVSSSRPNSTTDDDFDEDDDDDEEEEEEDEEEDDDEEENDLTNAASESCPESDSASNNDDNDEQQQADTKANAENKLEPISEEASTLRQRSDDENADDSTCCDEDFTWVRSEPTTPLQQQSSQPTAQPTKSTRPPASVDRRRAAHTLATTRQERDGKSRSTHSLREKSLSGDLKEKAQRQNHRASPAAFYWEPPPPPPVAYNHAHWDAPPYWPGSYHGASREELRILEFHRRQQDVYRYGSSGALSASQELYNGGGSCPCRYAPPCCPCEHKSHNTGNWNSAPNQRQDTDERLRRLQNEKESLALQVQVLTEQVSAQSEKMNDLERALGEKSQLLNSTDDLLQREMLTRSSLETQKLELMSAMSEMKLQQAALERENLELRASHLNNNAIQGRRPPLMPGRVLTASAASLTGNGTLHGSHGSLQQSLVGQSALTPKTPPSSYRRQMDLHYSSLPRQTFPASVNVSGNSPAITANNVDSNANPATSTPKQRNVAFALQHPQSQSSNSLANIYHHQLVLYQPNQPVRPLQKQRGFSVPNLAESEKVIDDIVDSGRSFTPQPQSPSLANKSSSKGLRAIFGKMRRSNSGTLQLEDLPGEGEFKRGGVRATAGARLGWSRAPQQLNKPFSQWDIDAVCVWLDEEMGLPGCEEDARKWLKNGAIDLIKASPVDIEKELSLKSPLHRKKIVLAITDLVDTSGSDEMLRNAGKLDTAWIMRWLDDAGLPQYKDAFAAARVDGRMLHKMTVDDLATLHVTSCLHAASMRRGIQVMRDNNWNADCLIRRQPDTDVSDMDRIALWTAHRVMEWLRVADLAEYAPNLRGAGVHGALMVYESRFTAELLADLLSIPPSKTLLRRHLAMRFTDLLGRDVIQGKRDAENTLGFQPLTLAAKIKTPKKSQFSLKRKKSSKGGGDEWSDFVCPMGPSGDHLPQTTTCTTTSNTVTNMMSPTRAAETAVESEVVSHRNNATESSPTTSSSSASANTT